MLACLCDMCENVPVRGTVAAECNAKIFGVLFDCEGVPFVKWTVRWGSVAARTSSGSGGGCCGPQPFAGCGAAVLPLLLCLL